jgi:hypothetical protein
VQKFSARGGRVLATWGTPGQGTGEFNRAEGVGVDSADNIYVADSCNHRIQIYSSEGKLLRSHGKAGTAAAELNYPYDVAVDAQGRQYVCEFGNSRIQIFDAHDNSIEIIGKAGAEPGHFANPWSVALDSKGNLYVADAWNHRVQKLVRGPRSKVQGPRSGNPEVVTFSAGSNAVPPLPGLLPMGEGESHSVSFAESAPLASETWLTGSLSRRERAGVRRESGRNLSLAFNFADPFPTLGLGPWTLDHSAR